MKLDVVFFLIGFDLLVIDSFVILAKFGNELLEVLLEKRICVFVGHVAFLNEILIGVVHSLAVKHGLDLGLGLKYLILTAKESIITIEKALVSIKIKGLAKSHY